MLGFVPISRYRHPQPSSLHGAVIPQEFEETILSKCYGLTAGEVVGSLQLNQKVPLVIRFCPNVSALEIPYDPYPRVSHNVTLMTRLASNNINRQPTVRFSSVSSMIIHVLDGYLAACLRLRLRCSQCGGGIQCTPQLPARRDRDPASNGHCGMCEYCITGACGDAREQNYATHSGEHSRDGGQHLWMLCDQVVHRVLQRERCVCHSSGGCAPLARDRNVMCPGSPMGVASRTVASGALLVAGALAEAKRCGQELSTVARSGSITSLLAENITGDMKSVELSCCKWTYCSLSASQPRGCFELARGSGLLNLPLARMYQ